MTLLLISLITLLFIIGCIHLNEIIPLINRPVLLRLKSEHGGLQTLLRNHCQIFEGTLHYKFLSVHVLVLNAY